MTETYTRVGRQIFKGGGSFANIASGSCNENVELWLLMTDGRPRLQINRMLRVFVPFTGNDRSQCGFYEASIVMGKK